MSATSYSAQTPRTVDEYLRLLRAALSDAPPALIQDALADAEDYMREEVALDVYKPESEVVARVTRTFGGPEEVAAEYKAVEARFQRRRGNDKAASYRGFFSIARDPKAYGALLYGLLALPLGIIYFVWVIVGISLSASFTALIIGIPFTLLFIASVRFMALLEGRVVESLLGQRMPRRLPTEEVVGGMWPKIKAMLSDRRTWSTMFYMVVQLPLGIAYFTIAVTGLALSLGLVATPLLGHLTGRSYIRVGFYDLQAFANSGVGAAVLVFSGLLLFFIVLHVVRGLTQLHGRYAEAVLVRT